MPKRSKIRLIHWKAEEAAAALEKLSEAGFDAEWEPFSPTALKSLYRHPPAAVVIDLSRLPSHGRDVAVALRGNKGSCMVPIVFVGGKADKVLDVRSLLPDAVFTAWDGIAEAIDAALREPPLRPIRPAGVLAGYAGKPLHAKLNLVREVSLDGAPGDFAKLLPEVSVRPRAAFTLWFVRSPRELEDGLAARRTLARRGGLWIVWPKKTSPLDCGLTQTLVRKAAALHGLVDFKVASIDETWTAFRFTVREKPSK